MTSMNLAKTFIGSGTLPKETEGQGYSQSLRRPAPKRNAVCVWRPGQTVSEVVGLGFVGGVKSLTRGPNNG